MKILKYVAGAVGTNSYLVWDEASKEAMIIDPGAYVPRMAGVIADENLTLKYIALTHGHGDHIGGVSEFMRRFPDVKLVAGEKEAPLLGDPSLNMSREISGVAESFTADISLKDGDEISLGDIVFRIFETPGHTPGGISFYAADASALDGGEYGGVAFTGDTLFQASIGRTDFPGGDFEILENSIRTRLYTLPGDTAVLPGHMGFTKIDYEIKHNPFVRG